jgi:hypothetical protein
MKLAFGRTKRRSLSLRNKRSRLSMELLEPRLNLALDVPVFSSLPGANQTIYLDFDGHVTSGTSWNSGATINSPAYSSDADVGNFSASEITVIQRTFSRVAEDFAPFQVNVTTVAPSVEDLRNTGGTDTKWGVRVVVTRDVAFNCGCGGIAYIDSFDWNSDTPVFVFNTSEIGVAEAASHEIGHSLGLSHDGTSTTGYYQGHGLGTDASYWSTIMGVGYYVDVSQWDKGEYTGSNNGGTGANYNKGPDDLQIITNYNGFGYKVDDHGNDGLTASALTAVDTALSGSGLISNRTDVDYFRFNTSGGSVTLNVTPATLGANLDIEASLYNSSGVLVSSSNPLQSLNASITTTLAAGQYFLKIDGVGAGTPTASTPTGYTDYASIGAYTITGTAGAVSGDSLSIGATDASKNESNSGGSVFTFTVSRTGDTSGTSTVSYAVSGSGSSPASASDFVGGALPAGSLSFAPGISSQLISINVQGDTTVESNEGFTVSLSNPSSTTVIGTASASGSILNDDSAPVAPTFGISATSANKSEGTSNGSTPFVFTITRAGNLAAASSVRYTVAGTGTNATSSNDFSGGYVKNVLVNFAAGVSTVDITVNVRADSRAERAETFKVTLSNAVGANISSAVANGTIQNDDGTGAAPSDEDSEHFELIAVADPLWMFMPAEYLTAEELAVPVMTWIDDVAYVGDVAHDHEGEEDHKGEEDHEAGTMSLYVPFDFDAGSRQLGSSVPRVLASSSGDLQAPVDDFLGVPSDEKAAPEWMDVVAIAGSAADESSSSFDSELFAKIDSAFSDTEEDWLTLKGILR